MTKRYCIAIAAAALLTACQQKQAPEAAFEATLKEVRTQHHFDGRLSVMDVELLKEEGELKLKGKTDCPAIKDDLLKALKEKGISVKDEVESLPEAELEGKVYAIIKNSVVNLRVTGRYSAGMAKQGTLGERLEVLEKEGSWYRVRTEDAYIGWLNGSALQLMTADEVKAWDGKEKVMYTKPYGFSYVSPKQKQTVTDLVYGNILSVEKKGKKHYVLSYPDGREAYVARTEVTPMKEWKATRKLNKENLVTAAKTFLGLPYHWGGNSYKGVDCSGFTRSVYLMNGLLLPRDASLQVFEGDEIDTLNNFAALEEGDLLFFGKPATETSKERVTHVGMWIGDNRFIHSAGNVHINSVNAADEDYDEYNHKRLLRVKRILGSGQLKASKDMTR